MAEETPSAWYGKFFKERVMPKVCNDMGECEGFLSWLAVNDPELNNKIDVAEKEIDILWLNCGDQPSFKVACRTWYDLLMKGKKQFDAAKEQEREKALLAGRQESLPIGGR